MGFNWINPLRIFQGVLSLAVLISAAVFVTGDQGGAGEGSFMIFVPLFTFIALAYLVGAPSFFPAIHNSWAALGIEALTWVLWLAGFAALAAMLPRYSCVSDSTTSTKLCGSLNGARAATVLGAFVWLAFCVSLGYYVYQLIQARRGDASGDGIQGNTPSGPYDQAVSMEQQPHYPQQQQYAPHQQQQQQYPPQQEQYPPQQQYAPHQQQY